MSATSTRRVVRLYALRHGEPERTDLFYGHHDVALSCRGREQAAGQAAVLSSAPLHAVYTSDLTRAAYGAHAVAEPHGLTPTVDVGLREMSLGQLENVPHAEAATRYPDVAKRSYGAMLDYRMPGGGESVRDVAARVLPVVNAAVLAHAFDAAPSSVSDDPKRPYAPGIVVYAHNTVTRLLLSCAAGMGPAGYFAFTQRFGALNRVDLPVVGGRVAWEDASIAYANRDAGWSRAGS